MLSRGKKLSARVLHEDVDGETGKTLKFNPVEVEGAAEPTPNRRKVRRETLPQEAANEFEGELRRLGGGNAGRQTGANSA